MINKCVRKFDDECTYAASDSTPRQQLARLIKNEFFVLKELYRKIKNSSPRSILYVIGYPQFIADSNAPCEFNAGNVSDKERHFMNEATHYMNLVIQNATKAAGAEYIDIEHSLDGGRLCEGLFTDYVTGIRSEQWIQALGYDSLNEYLYHPNAAGHKKIAEVIENYIGTNIYDFNEPADDTIRPPEYTDYFAGAKGNTIPVHPTKTLQRHVLIQGQTVESIAAPLTYAGSSSVTISRYSTPEVLGSYTSSVDGGLRFTMNIPIDFPVGNHQLVFKATSPSGEEIELVEDFFVKGRDAQDMDADGIKDAQDECLFIVPSGYDEDADNIDDACDNVINPGAINIPTTRLSKGVIERTKEASNSGEQLSYTNKSAHPSDKRSNYPSSTNEAVLGSKLSSHSNTKHNFTVILLVGSVIILGSIAFIIYRKKKP